MLVMAVGRKATVVTQWLASSLALPAGATFARTGSALYLSGTPFSSAVYATAGANAARYEQLSSGSIGLLIEGAATNVVFYSYDLANATGWTDISTTTGQVANQLGLTGSANTATLLSDVSTGGLDSVAMNASQGFASAASTFAFTMLVRKDNTTSRFPELRFYMNPSTGSSQFMRWNTSTGAATSQANGGTLATAVVSRDRGQWWEVGCYGTKPNLDTFANLEIIPAAGSSITTYDLPVTGSIIVGGVSVTVGSAVVTSPIQTNGAAASRGAETLSMAVSSPAGGFAVAFNAKTAWGKTGDQYLWSRDDGTANNRCALKRNSTGAIVLEAVSGGVAQAAITGATVADNTEVKLSASFAANSMQLCVGATLGTRDTVCTLPTGMTTQRLGTDHASANPWQGAIISGQFGPLHLGPQADAGLQALNV